MAVVLLDAQQVGRATDAERSEIGQGSPWLPAGHPTPEAPRRFWDLQRAWCVGCSVPRRTINSLLARLTLPAPMVMIASPARASSQEKLNSRLHRAEIVNVFVPGVANGGGQSFAGDARNWGFACGIDVQQHQHVGLIEGPAELVPEVLGAREPMRLEEHEQAIELAASRGFERGANFGGMVAVIVNDGDVVNDALDVEAAANAGEFRQAFADQIGWNI